MKDVFLGIDLGTGGARAGLFDDEGHALAFKDSPVVSHYPHPGWVEQSAEDWWEALVNSVRAVVAATGVKPEQIRGIGYDATSATVVAVDANNNPLRRAIFWSDVRSSEQADRAFGIDHWARLYNGGGKDAASAEWFPFKAIWIKENEPETYNKAVHLVDAPDWLTYKLTGEWTVNINSAAHLKAFCGRHGGIVCTSSNAGTIAEWSFRQREKILFFPDQHLGRWTGHKMGIPLDEMMVWDPDLPLGGLTPEQIRKAKLLLWKGHCSVHQMFQPAHIRKFRAEHPDGLVISHPECSFEVCQLSDYVGSTEHIVKIVKEAPANTRWLVGTELNLVNRLAEEVKPEGKIVQFMSPTVCMCSTMQRIDPQHLAWTLENLADGNVVNQIRVPEHEAQLARLAVEKMLAAS